MLGVYIYIYIYEEYLHFNAIYNIMLSNHMADVNIRTSTLLNVVRTSILRLYPTNFIYNR
jgi:CRISPR/Cas system-associated endonuclease Cas3-HD